MACAPSEHLAGPQAIFGMLSPWTVKALYGLAGAALFRS
jgi:hypothetical protein